MGIRNLRVERLQSPIGVDSRAPSFSFESDAGEGLFSVSLFSGNEALAEQERTVFGEECNSFRFFHGLSAGRLYRWEVSDGKICVSSHFETAEVFDFPFVTTEAITETLPVFCTAVEIPSDTRAARLYICASSAHAVFFNGERVFGKGLETGRPQEVYWIYNLSAYMWRGSENTLRILLSECVGTGLAVGVILYLHNGTRCVYTTDETWQVCESGILYDPVLHREVYDPVSSMPRHIHAVICDTPTVSRRPSGVLPERKKAHEAVCITAMADGGFLLDFGRMLRGFVRFRTKALSGTQIRLHLSLVGDKPSDGQAEFLVCTDGRTEVYEPVFAREFFRYVFVYGLSEIEAQQMEAVEIFS